MLSGLRPGRQRPVLAVRRLLRQRPAAARAGHRGRQGAARRGRPGGPVDRPVRPRRHRRPGRDGRRLRRPGQGGRRHRQRAACRHLLGRRVPQAHVRHRASGAPAPYLNQVAAGSLASTAPYPETHWPPAGQVELRRAVQRRPSPTVDQDERSRDHPRDAGGGVRRRRQHHRRSSATSSTRTRRTVKGLRQSRANRSTSTTTVAASRTSGSTLMPGASTGRQVDGGHRRSSSSAGCCSACSTSCHRVDRRVPLTQALLGDPAKAILGRDGTAGDAWRRSAHELGLDRPVLNQYVGWLGGLLRGDPGTSFTARQPVTEVAGRAGRQLAVPRARRRGRVDPAVAVALGAYAALRRDKPFDTAAAYVLLVAGVDARVRRRHVPRHAVRDQGVARVRRRSAPGARRQTLERPRRGWSCRCATLVLVVTPYVARAMRASMIEVLESDYVEMARLKGLPERVGAAGGTRCPTRSARRSRSSPSTSRTWSAAS